MKSVSEKFEHSVGDLRDDINDSWGSDVNREEADRVLDFLFSLQNPPEGVKAMNVVILSGDIHTGAASGVPCECGGRHSGEITFIVLASCERFPLCGLEEGEEYVRTRSRSGCGEVEFRLHYGQCCKP